MDYPRLFNYRSRTTFYRWKFSEDAELPSKTLWLKLGGIIPMRRWVIEKNEELSHILLHENWAIYHEYDGCEMSLDRPKARSMWSEIMNHEPSYLTFWVGIIGVWIQTFWSYPRFQISNMRRQNMAKRDRKDFFLYRRIPKLYYWFIESILSKHVNIDLEVVVIAHQYICNEKSDASQKSSLNLKWAIFGNVGTIWVPKLGLRCRNLWQTICPTYSDQDFVNMDKFKRRLNSQMNQPTLGFYCSSRSISRASQCQTGAALKSYLASNMVEQGICRKGYISCWR